MVHFDEAVERIGKAVDLAGVAVIVLGIIAASALSLRRLPTVPPKEEYRRYRQAVGRAILLGLEILVAADIIRTVAVDPTLTSAGVLAIIVAIRTLLSFSLEVELEGRWPWQRPAGAAETEEASHVGPG